LIQIKLISLAKENADITLLLQKKTRIFFSGRKTHLFTSKHNVITNLFIIVNHFLFITSSKIK